MATIVTRQDLIDAEGDLTFRGRRHGAGNVSFILVELGPGEGPRLHRHAYAETFVILEGTATYRVGDEVIEASAGEIVVGPADVPHAFTNTGTGMLRQIDIHDTADILTEWLDS